MAGSELSGAGIPSGARDTELDVLSFLDTLGADNGTAERCYRSHSRSSVLQGLPFGGVPTVLALNFILWLFLLLIFSCLRKAAWDYGRLALLMDNDSFVERRRLISYDLTSLFYGEPSEKEKSPSESSPSDTDVSKDVGFCSWLTSLYHMKDEEIRSKCGIDATTYLSFQRHIILLMMVVCLLSVAVILPINFSGNLLGDSPQNFGRTTVANVPARDSFLWLHSVFALLYFIITALCMAHHSSRLEYREDEKVARTLMVTDIPKDISDPGLITKHFHEAYPSCTVTDIRFCFDVRKLMKLDAERRKAMKGRLYFTGKAQKEGRIMIKTHPCAQIFCCDICGFEQVDAEQYYSELEEKLTDEFNAEKNRISLKRLDMAFITFRDERMTAVIVKDYGRTRCRRRPQQSSITTVVRSHKWGVGYAPAPNDIIWENLSVRGSRWWLRCVLLNIFLFILLFFLTTPAIIVNTMDKFNVTRPVESLRNPIITQFFPTLLLWAFSVLLPFIVYYSAFFESHWTRSNENQITMHKCFLLLVFMVIVLPSLGLSSLDLFFRWLFDIHFLDERDIKFQCVFLPDNGAFFVNYVITSSLIGTAMELLRIPALMVYALRLCFAKSEAERIHVKRSQAYEFQFGLEYAWTMCIFAVSMTYSITCPIIVPFGLLYLVLKHLVDRYNIYYAYVPTKLNQRIHSAAVSQVIVAPVLCMLWLLFFSVLRLGPMRPITLFTFVSLLSCIAFSLFRICLKKLQPAKPTSYQMSDQPVEGGFNDTERSSVSSTPNSNLFVASVLQEPELGLTPMASPAHQSYGTMGTRRGSSRGPEEEAQSQTYETELQEPQEPQDPFSSSPLTDAQEGYQ
ncbi:calcium permeable stress-gated cation channel 1 isoform X1 [Anguilla rostrata]|uniref:calcium permeable stress-gated cation channel 1 isoform X1 n=1 Tax=Anguilla rostrata TaxID=7938 RepID=UPI0030D2CAF7